MNFSWIEDEDGATAIERVDGYLVTANASADGAYSATVRGASETVAMDGDGEVDIESAMLAAVALAAEILASLDAETNDTFDGPEARVELGDAVAA